MHTYDITVSLGGSSKKVEFNGENGELGWRITLANTGLETLTGARVKRVQKYLEGQENFMLTYGDGVGNVDLEKLGAFHRNHGKIMTVTGVRPPARFGELMSDPGGRVTEFNEKPQATSGLISGGFFVCRQELFDYLDDRENLMLETEPMKRLVADGQMMVFEHEGFWQPMDTYRDYLYLNDIWAKQKAPWKIW